MNAKKFSMAAGRQAFEEEKKLTEEQKKEIEKLEGQMKDLKSIREIALNQVKEAFGKKEIDEGEKLIANAEIDAEYLKDFANIEAKIKSINPGWAKTASEFIAIASEKISDSAEDKAEKAGSWTGSVVNPFIQLGKRFTKGVKNAIK